MARQFSEQQLLKSRWFAGEALNILARETDGVPMHTPMAETKVQSILPAADLELCVGAQMKERPGPDLGLNALHR